MRVCVRARCVCVCACVCDSYMDIHVEDRTALLASAGMNHHFGSERFRCMLGGATVCLYHIPQSKLTTTSTIRNSSTL